MSQPEVGDIVRIKKPSNSREIGNFVVRLVNTARIGRPCTLYFSSGNPAFVYPYPSDCLEVVNTQMREKPEEKRMRELEERVAHLERLLKVKL